MYSELAPSIKIVSLYAMVIVRKAVICPITHVEQFISYKDTIDHLSKRDTSAHILLSLQFLFNRTCNIEATKHFECGVLWFVFNMRANFDWRLCNIHSILLGSLLYSFRIP